MNILLMHTHDSGRFLQPYGYAVETPNLQTFAEQGLLFRQAFSVAPTCSPSRAGMLTGQYPHNCGMFGLAHRGFRLPDYKKHIANYLKDFGFETILCGIQHEAPDAEMIGYTRILDKQNFDMGCIDFDSFTFDKENAELVCDYLKEYHDKPFFLSFGLYNTHRKWKRHEDDINSSFVKPFPGIFDNEENREDMADYMSSIRLCDMLVGNILKTLEESGLRENTMIIFTTDHGPAIPNMKCTLYDGGTGVALIVDYPNNPAKGKCIDTMVSQLDIYPTICEICGINKPDWLEGQSFQSILGNKATSSRALYSEINYHAAYEPMRAVRTERYKYIRRFDNESTVILSNVDNCPEKTFLFENRCFDSIQYDSNELYDLYKDPMEQHNVIDNINYKNIQEEMEHLLEIWMNRTDDPLLSGFVQPPENAKVNCRSDYCAEDLITEDHERSGERRNEDI